MENLQGLEDLQLIVERSNVDFDLTARNCRRPMHRRKDVAMMNRYEAAFARLAKSKFRSRFHLSALERSVVNEKGIATIRAHCEGFNRTRLAPAYPAHDGSQTPMRGHPVFVAQHAITAPCGGGDPWGSRNAERTERSEEVPREPSACCCRDCLAKWWKVPRGVAIPEERQEGIVNFLIAWIEKEMER